MKYRYLVALKLALFFYSVVCFLGGDYQKTKIYIEPSSCLSGDFYGLLATNIEVSVFTCGQGCSYNPDCRRFMFDRKTKICSMFEAGENCLTDENIEDKICFRQLSLCTEVNCTRCPIGYYGDTCQYVIKDCSVGAMMEIYPPEFRLSYIQPAADGPILEVKCQFRVNWRATIIQHRQSRCKEVDFYRNWDDYENGFGLSHSEYWFGLKHLHNILDNNEHFQLRVRLETRDLARIGYYHEFKLFGSINGYKFSSAFFEDDEKRFIGDSLTNGTFNLEGRPFSTYDNEHTHYNCSSKFKSGWWFLDDSQCSRSNLNGKRNDSEFEAMIHWLDNLGSLTDYISCEMRIIGKSF